MMKMMALNFFSSLRNLPRVNVAKKDNPWPNTQNICKCFVRINSATLIYKMETFTRFVRYPQPKTDFVEKQKQKNRILGFPPNAPPSLFDNLLLRYLVD